MVELELFIGKELLTRPVESRILARFQNQGRVRRAKTLFAIEDSKSDDLSLIDSIFLITKVEPEMSWRNSAGNLRRK